MTFNYYKKFIETDKNEIKSGVAGLKKLAVSFTFVAIVFLSEQVFGMSAIVLTQKSWLDSNPLWLKIFICTPILVLQRFKYYFFWYLSEGINVLAGLGYDEAQKNWDYITNNHPLKVELAGNIQELVNNWNMAATKWLRIVAYERIENKKYNSLVVFALSAMWHGYFPGQYIFFTNAHFTLMAYRNCKSTLIPYLYQYKFKTWKNLQKLMNLVGMVWLHVTFNFVGVCFTILLSFENCLYFLNSCYYLPNLSVLCLALLPLSSYFGKYDRAGNLVVRNKTKDGKLDSKLANDLPAGNDLPPENSKIDNKKKI